MSKALEGPCTVRDGGMETLGVKGQGAQSISEPCHIYFLYINPSRSNEARPSSLNIYRGCTTCLLAHVFKQVTNVSLLYSLGMLFVKIILQDLKIHHFSCIVMIILFHKMQQFTKVLSSPYPRNFHYLSFFFFVERRFNIWRILVGRL